MIEVINEAISFDDPSLGMIAKIQRVLQRLTQQEMASMAGVYQVDVDLFESNQRLPSITELKLLNAYNVIIDANMVETPF